MIKVFVRVVAFVILPVMVGCGLIHVIRTRATPSQTPNPAQPSNGTETEAVPPPVPAPPTVMEIDRYQRVSSPLPRALLALEAELGGGVLVAPQRRLILWGKEEDTAMPIASMTKMMTLLVALERINESQAISLETPIQVTKEAELTGGRRVWLAAGHTYTPERLLKTAMIYSANDACQAVAVGLAPDHDVKKFLVMMNRRARTLGMKRAQFFNVHGMPETRDNQATPKDLVILALELQKYPDAIAWSSLQNDKFVHNNGKVVDLTNSNADLLNGCPGVTGLKTGYTDRAGSCVTATCVRSGELLIAVTGGFHTKKVGIKGKDKRTQFVSGLLDWGYQVLAALDQQEGR